MIHSDNLTSIQQLTDQPAKPQYIHEQHNQNCQQFFGPISNCVFAMPGANVYQQPFSTKGSASSPTKKTKTKTETSSKKTSALPKVTAKTAKSAKAKAATRELMTFRKNGVLDANLTLLHQLMVKDGWIDERTTAADFCELFSGNRSECKIIWKSKYGKGTLVFLFRYFEMDNLITVDKGFTIPNILMGHFVDEKGLYLTNLDKGDDVADKAAKEIEEYMRIMHLNPTRKGRKSQAIIEADDLPEYGDGYDPYDHQDLNYHNRHGY